jgi:hypothetical protein
MRASFANATRGALSATLLAASTAGAQLPSASTAAFGMGGNFTAIARGYEAVRWNPANLAMPGRPFISFGTAIASGNIGLEPVDISTIHGYKVNADVDDSTKAQWVEMARLAGGQRIRLDAGATYLGLSVGPLGFQLGSSAYSNVTLSPDAWEAMLFGNAGASGGQPKDLDLTGTSIRAGAFTTGAMSLALPIPFSLSQGIFRNERAAIGITGKYIGGHGVAVADDQGTAFAGQDITLNFPVIMPDSTVEDFLNPLGTGFGADVSLAWSGGPWKIGVLAENVFNTFAWDTSRFVFRPGTGAISATNDTTDFEERPFEQAPQSIKDIIVNQAFKPGFTVGVAFQPIGSLTLTADMKSYTGGDEAIIFGSKSHFGVGAEWRLLGFLPLRGGVASVADGWQAGAGFGLRFMGYELGLSSSVRRRGSATESGLMFGVVGIGR